MRTIRKEPDCAVEPGEEVAVEGLYRAMMLPRSARPGSPLFESDRVVLELSDGHLVAVETHAAGIRSPEEKRLFLGKRVRVVGSFLRWAQLWGSPEESAIVMDAVTGISSIEEKS